MCVRNHEPPGASHVQTKVEVTVHAPAGKRRIRTGEVPPHPDAASAHRDALARTQRRFTMDAHRTRADDDRRSVEAAQDLPDRPVWDRWAWGGRRNEEERKGENDRSPHGVKDARWRGARNPPAGGPSCGRRGTNLRRPISAPKAGAQNSIRGVNWAASPLSPRPRAPAKRSL
jgi:hypothetical protein